MDVDKSLIYTALLLLCASVVAVLFCIQRRGPRLPPGPRGLPILGFLPWIDPKAPHLTLTDLAKVYGSIYTVKLGSVLAVVLSDHCLIREAFAKDIFTGRAPLFLTHGIMNGYGEYFVSSFVKVKQACSVVKLKILTSTICIFRI
jgi:ecdysteroid 25-hydroxylase CYP306A1